MPRPFCLIATLALVLATACKGADGATGPEGPQGPAGPAGEEGPGTRITFTGVIGTSGGAVAVLPPAAGTAANLPALACYISEDGQTWLVLAVDTNADAACGIGANAAGQLAAVMTGVPVGWRYTFVVVY